MTHRRTSPEIFKYSYLENRLHLDYLPGLAIQVDLRGQAHLGHLSEEHAEIVLQIKLYRAATHSDAVDLLKQQQRIGWKRINNKKKLSNKPFSHSV